MIWAETFIKIAEVIAQRSKDPSTKTGVVIVNPDNRSIISCGYNGFPRGVLDLSDLYNMRDSKYPRICHAETNAIFNAARLGIPTNNCTMYTSFGPIVCCDCAKAVIQSGIREIVGRKIINPFAGGRWKESIEIANKMLTEAGIKQTEI